MRSAHSTVAGEPAPKLALGAILWYCLYEIANYTLQAQDASGTETGSVVHNKAWLYPGDKDFDSFLCVSCFAVLDSSTSFTTVSAKR